MSLSPTPITLLAALLILGLPLGAAEDHAGHAHAPGAGHGHAHGPSAPLGSVLIGTTQMAVAATGGAVPGKEWPVDLRLDPAQPAPKAIRVWVGVENGRGSVKAKAVADADTKGGYEAHVEVPQPLPAEARLWISLEGEGGQTVKGSLPLTGPGHQHREGDGHKH